MKRKKPVLQRKPEPVLYFIGCLAVKIYCLIHYHLKIKGVRPKGPAIILSNHTSNPDYKFVASATFPSRINFLGSSFWFSYKKYAFWLNKIAAIPKIQFSTDIVSLKKMRYVVQENKGLVFIAPEGTVYANGKLGFISPSIAKMIQFLNVDVYTCKIQGAGLGMSKWSKYSHRCHVQIETNLAIKAQDCKALSRDEIMKIIKNNLEYNEFEYQAKYNIKTKAKNLAEGFETMFYKCPCCGSEFELKTSGNTIECDHCHAKATIQDTFRFKWEGEKQYFDNYIEWYDWQFNDLKNQMRKPDFVLEDDVEYGVSEPGVSNYIKVGDGHLTFSNNGWDYKGTFKGKYIEEHDETGQVFLAVLRAGVHFELPLKDEHTRIFHPKKGVTSMKWHLASRAMSELLAEKED